MPNSKTIGQQVKNSNLPIDVKPTKQAIHILRNRLFVGAGFLAIALTGICTDIIGADWTLLGIFIGAALIYMGKGYHFQND